MTHIYCVICQARVGTDRSKYQKLINEELINTINLSRPDIINQLKKMTMEFKPNLVTTCTKLVKKSQNICLKLNNLFYKKIFQVLLE